MDEHTGRILLAGLGVAALGMSVAGCMNGTLAGKGRASSVVTIYADGNPGVYLDVRSADFQKIKTEAPYGKFMGDAPGDLIRCFRLLTGTNLPTEPGEGRIPLRLRLLDRDEDSRAADPLGHQGYLLEVSDREIVLAAPRLVGVFGAIYDVLNQWGCRWIMPGDDGEVIPRKDRLELPTGTFRKNKRMDARCVANATDDYGWWRARNGLGTEDWLPLSHFWPALVPPEQYFKEHPDYFAMVNGQRVPSQLETANHELVELLIEKSKEFVRRPGVAGVPMEFNDNLDYSMSPESLALDPPNNPTYRGIPSMSDRLVTLANQVGAGIEKEFPDKVVTILGYTHHTLPPVHARPRSNVVVGLTRMSFSLVHLMPRAKDPLSRAYWDLLAGWLKVSPHVYTYDYVPIYWTGGLPSPLLLEYPRALKKAYAMGVKGNYAEKPARCDASDFVGDYLEWRIKADPGRDPAAELRELCAVFFGPAGPSMNRYYLALAKATDTIFPPHNFSQGTMLVYEDLYTPDLLTEARQQLEAAARTVANDSTYQRRVQMVRLTFDYLEAFMNGLWQARAGHYEQSVARFSSIQPILTALHAMNPNYLDVKYAQGHIEEAKGKTLARYFPDRFGFYRSWLLLGPLDNHRRDADIPNELFPSRRFPNGVRVGEPVTLADQTTLAWQPYTSPEGLMEFTRAFAKTKRNWMFSSAYAATTVESPQAQMAQIRADSFFPFRVFVNGTEVYHRPGLNRDMPDRYVIPVSLQAGQNWIVVRSSETVLPDHIFRWGFYFRLTDPAGHPLPPMQKIP